MNRLRPPSPLLSWPHVPRGRGGWFFLPQERERWERLHSLLSMTPLLAPAQVVGRTDIVFGFVVFAHRQRRACWFTHATNPELLLQLIIGGVAGAVCGTVLSTHVPGAGLLRFALWVWLLILGGQFLFNSYTRHGPPRVRASPLTRIP